jgi:hypothetical protein
MKASTFFLSAILGLGYSHAMNSRAFDGLPKTTIAGVTVIYTPIVQDAL